MNKRLALALVALLVLSMVFTAHGGDIDSRVTALTVNPTALTDGGKATVRLEFSEAAGAIQGGNTIDVTWPSSGELYFEGFAKTIPLMVQGRHVADAVISKSGATITFNDYVNNLDDVTGWVEFEILGRNLTDTPEENTKTGTIVAGGKRVQVSVTKPESGIAGTFYYKTGNIDPSDTEHVTWWLNINNEKAYVTGQIRIDDAIQGGQVLKMDSFNIAVSGQRNEDYYGANAINDFVNDFPGAGIWADAAANTITVVIPEGWASLNAFSIMYNTTITEPNQEWFSNNSTAWFQEHNKPAVVGGKFNHSVENIHAGGGVTGTVKGELKINKVIQGTAIGVPGVGFILKRVDGGVIVDDQTEITLTTDENGVANIKKLPVAAYTVKEISAPEWIDFDPLSAGELSFSVQESDAEGILLDITNHVKKVSVPVSKAWEDGNNQDGVRPDSVVIKLLADGLDTGRTLELSQANRWAGSFADLDEYKDGQKIVYTVAEVTVAGYTVAITGDAATGFIVTNTHAVEKIAIEGTKTWDDSNDQGGKRPESITIRLLANGKEVASKEVAGTEWRWKFEGLDKFEDGQEIVYTVTEDVVEDYTATINDHNVTNRYTPGKTSVQVTKAWADANNQDGIRPGAVTVKLLADGAVTDKELILTALNNWTGTFTDLDEYKDGQKIVYTVAEVTVAGYTVAITGDAATGFIVTNTHAVEKISLEGRKTWDDSDDQDGKRPESITIRLLANGKEVASKEVAGSEWHWRFEDLDKFEDGQEIVYTVEEDAVEGYTATIHGYHVTNRYTPGKTSVPVIKIWEDADNQDGKRPDSVVIKLLADGLDTGRTLELNQANHWAGSFADLDEYKDGQKIVYTVAEVTVAGYTVAITGDAVTGYKVTNAKEAPPPPPSPTYPVIRVRIEGNKVLRNGALKAGQFTFVLMDINGKVLAEVQNQQDGSIVFPDRTFSKAVHNYIYTIREIPGKDPRIAYDKSVYTLKVTTTPDNGQLQAKVDVLKDGVPYAGAITFTNITETPPTGDTLAYRIALMLLCCLALLVAAVVIIRKDSKAHMR